MKELSIEYKNFSRVKKTKAKLGFERILIVIFIIAFLTLLLSQTVMLIPALKSIVVSKDTLEGLPLAEEEYLYTEGKMELKLLDADGCPALGVLVNGEERYSFSESIIKLNVIDGDVVEIDGSKIAENIKIVVSSISKNIPAEFLGKIFYVDGKVQKLFKINLSVQ